MMFLIYVYFSRFMLLAHILSLIRVLTLRRSGEYAVKHTYVS